MPTTRLPQQQPWGCMLGAAAMCIRAGEGLAAGQCKQTWPHGYTARQRSRCLCVDLPQASHH